MKFCVIGLGRFGFQLATTLAENGMEVLGVDKNEKIVAQISDHITQAITMEVVDENALQALGVEHMDAVLVTVGENFAQSILITALLKKRLKVARVITRSIGDIHAEILRLIGADQIILPEQEMGKKIADQLSLPFHALTRIAPQFSVAELNAPDSFAGKTVEELALHEKYQVTCLGIIKDMTLVPASPDSVIDEHDKIICSGPNEQLEAISEL